MPSFTSRGAICSIVQCDYTPARLAFNSQTTVHKLEETRNRAHSGRSQFLSVRMSVRSSNSWVWTIAARDRDRSDDIPCIYYYS